MTPGAGAPGDMVGAVAGPDGLAVDPEDGALLAPPPLVPPPLAPPDVCASAKPADPVTIDTTPTTAASDHMHHLTSYQRGKRVMPRRVHSPDLRSAASSGGAAGRRSAHWRDRNWRLLARQRLDECHERPPLGH